MRRRSNLLISQTCSTLQILTLRVDLLNYLSVSKDLPQVSESFRLKKIRILMWQDHEHLELSELWNNPLLSRTGYRLGGMESRNLIPSFLGHGRLAEKGGPKTSDGIEGEEKGTLELHFERYQRCVGLSKAKDIIEIFRISITLTGSAKVCCETGFERRAEVSTQGLSRW